MPRDRNRSDEKKAVGGLGSPRASAANGSGGGSGSGSGSGSTGSASSSATASASNPSTASSSGSGSGSAAPPSTPARGTPSSHRSRKRRNHELAGASSSSSDAKHSNASGSGGGATGNGSATAATTASTGSAAAAAIDSESEGAGKASDPKKHKSSSAAAASSSSASTASSSSAATTSTAAAAGSTSTSTSTSVGSSSSSSGSGGAAKPVETKAFDEKDLHCIVCFDFPAGDIFQCERGHLLCGGCHTILLEQPRPQCPNCRVRLSRDRASRNRFAEMVLSRLLVACSHAGCTDKLEFRAVSKHERELCGHRRVKCKYHEIGCDWAGLAHAQAAHEKGCDLLTKKPKSILRRVQKRNALRAAEAKKVDDTHAAQSEVCRVLTSRCKDVHVKDVILARDTTFGKYCSKPFYLFGGPMPWEMFASKPGKEPFGVYLRASSRIRHKLTLQLSILPGPTPLPGGISLAPTTHKVVLRRKSHKTPLLPLPLTKEQATSILEQPVWNVRLLAVDQSGGRPAHGFTTEPSTAAASDDDSSSSDDDGGDAPATDTDSDGEAERERALGGDDPDAHAEDSPSDEELALLHDLRRDRERRAYGDASGDDYDDEYDDEYDVGEDEAYSDDGGDGDII